jgi:hypothetical protein
MVGVGSERIAEDSMYRSTIGSTLFLGFLVSSAAIADEHADAIASAESAAPASVTANATIKDTNGTTLRKGSNGYTCYPQQETMGPMCNEAVWDALIEAMMNKKDFSANKFSISYMLAGEGTAIGVSNSDPYATDPKSSDDWIKEGPHIMIAVPDPSMLEGLSRDPRDPVYVMWGDTPYAHIMVRIAE